ncbi:MAG: DUF6272 family protein [Spirulinaceae cyanobacterium]
MKQVFGDYGHNLPATQEYLILQFSPSSVPIKKRWRNNGLSADFLGDYLTTFFLNNEIELNEMEHQAEIKGAVSYIANELLENAMKFNDEEKDYPISISLHFHRDRVVFSTTNSISSQYQDKLKVFINKLATYDPQELYILQLEENAQGDNDTNSGLGFLTIINDYMAKVGWKLETVQQNPEIVALTTLVQLKL